MTLYISRVEIENIRCFAKKLTIEFGSNGSDPTWTLLVGDNAVGKTTVLRCIAMGLCDSASAAGLLRESDEGMIRRTEEHGHIKSP